MGADQDVKVVQDAEAASDTPEQTGDLYERRLSAVEWAKYHQTRRGLSPRQAQIMAIGSSIGTGLFVGVGKSLSSTGPLSLLLGFLFWCLLFIWPCNLCVAEMCAYLPVKGTVFELAGRYVDPAMGFAMGWTYFFAGAMLVCTEYSAVAAVIQYWNADINPAAWVAICIVVCFAVNMVAVKWYGESEFIMASTKILLLVGLILITLITMCGGNPKHDAYGFRYWGNGNAMHPYYTTGTTGNFLGWWTVVRYAAFSVGGPDLISLAAGEIQNPRRTIPRVARLVFYRLCGFYILGVLCVGIICSSRDTRLLGAIKSGAAGSAASPWVIGIQNLGITGLPDLINVLILLSGLSCGNAYLYSTSRTLYALARDGQAPKIFMKCTESGIPIWCVSVVTLLSCLTFLVASNSAVTVFYWFVYLSTIAFVLVYTGMLVTFIGWYRALKAQGIDRSTLPYQAPFAPYTAWLAITIGVIVMIFIGFDSFVPWDVQGFITSYFGLGFAVVMFTAWKVIKRTKFVDPKTCDLISGKAAIDEECKIWEDGGLEINEKKRLAEMSLLRRTWERIW